MQLRSFFTVVRGLFRASDGVQAVKSLLVTEESKLISSARATIVVLAIK